MKYTYRKEVTEEVTTVRITAAVNYEEEEIPNDFPGRDGETWTARINIDTGVIEDWPEGREEHMHLTVKDCGSYELIGPNGVIAERANNYVPHGLIPGKYGDVIELKIDGAGKIANWPKSPNLSGFDSGEEE